MTDDWRLQARCAESDPELFTGDVPDTATAKGICGGCDVRDECLSSALRTHSWHGIWGGKTEQERRQISRTLRLPAQARQYKAGHPGRRSA